MFHTGLYTKVTGYSAREAITKYAPDGTLIAEIGLGVGDGSEKYPVQWVKITVWDKLAEEAENVIDRKGIAVEAYGMLKIGQYHGKHGMAIAIELKNVRELKIFDRDGEVVGVLTGGMKE